MTNVADCAGLVSSKPDPQAKETWATNGTSLVGQALMRLGV